MSCFFDAIHYIALLTHFHCVTAAAAEEKVQSTLMGSRSGSSAVERATST